MVVEHPVLVMPTLIPVLQPVNGVVGDQVAPVPAQRHRHLEVQLGHQVLQECKAHLAVCFKCIKIWNVCLSGVGG